MSIEHPNMGPVETSANWGLLGTILWGIGVALIFILLQLGVTLILVMPGQRDLSEQQMATLLASAENDGFMLSVITIVSALVCVPLVVGIAALKRKSKISDYFALKPVTPRSLILWLGGLMLVIALSDGLTALLGKPVVPVFMRAAYDTAQPQWLFWLALVVAAPLFEETFFRGFLYTGFASTFMGSAGARAVTAALWAAIHVQYDLYGIVSIFFLGIFFGLARRLAGSLSVPVALHAASNVIAIAEAALRT